MGLAKLIALLMVLLLMGSSLVGLIVYFIKLIHQNRKHPVSISFLENNGVFYAKQFDFQVKIKTLDRLTPISKANKAISNLLIF